MRSYFAHARCRLAMWLIAGSAFGILLLGTIKEAMACDNQICAPGLSCGGNGNPPGILNICSQDQQGDACTYCDGTAKIRVCAGAGGGGRNCTLTQNPTNCGQGWDGICTQYVPYIGPTYYYCKSGSNKNNNKCQSTQECTGDVACPG